MNFRLSTRVYWRLGLCNRTLGLCSWKPNPRSFAIFFLHTLLCTFYDLPIEGPERTVVYLVNFNWQLECHMCFSIACIYMCVHGLLVKIPVMILAEFPQRFKNVVLGCRCSNISHKNAMMYLTLCGWLGSACFDSSYTNLGVISDFCGCYEDCLVSDNCTRCSEKFWS